MDFVALLYGQRLPPPDIALIIENMLGKGEIGNKGWERWNYSKPIQPSAYDFIDFVGK